MSAADRDPSLITNRVLSEVLAERIRQDTLWGQQNYPLGTGPKVMALGRPTGVWADMLKAEGARLGQGDNFLRILLEEVMEAGAESDPVKVREELVQVAAVAVMICEAIDRRSRVDLFKPIAWGVDLSALISDLPDTSAFSADALARVMGLPEGSVELRWDATPIPFLLPPDELTITVIKPGPVRSGKTLVPKCPGCAYGDGTVVKGVTMRHAWDETCTERIGRPLSPDTRERLFAVMKPVPCPGCGHAEHSGFCRELCMPTPGDVDECGCLAPGYCDRCGGTGIDPEHSGTEGDGNERREVPEPCSQCQFPALCDGCGHAEHVANQCSVVTYGERCECDEPWPPAPVLITRESSVWVKGQCPYCTGSENPDIRDHVRNVHPDLFAGWQDHLSTHPLPDEDPFHQPLDPEIRDRLFTKAEDCGEWVAYDPADDEVECECGQAWSNVAAMRTAGHGDLVCRATETASSSDSAGVPEYTDADRAAISECTHWKFPGAVCSHDTDPPSVTPEEIDANYAKDLVEDARPPTAHHHTFDRLHGFCRCGERPEE